MTKVFSRRSKLYAKAFATFSKQFGIIRSIVKVYVNDEGQVFAGEWIDNNGKICFNAGYAIDAVRTIEFED